MALNFLWMASVIHFGAVFPVSARLSHLPLPSTRQLSVRFPWPAGQC